MVILRDFPYMAGWCYTYPSRQMGLLFPTEWKVMKFLIKFIFQTKIQQYQNSGIQQQKMSQKFITFNHRNHQKFAVHLDQLMVEKTPKNQQFTWLRRGF